MNQPTPPYREPINTGHGFQLPEGMQVASPPPPPAVYYPGQIVVQPRARTDGLAVASMVLGILWLFWLGSILAVIFGHVALRRLNRGETDTGRGMAVAGLVLGYIGVATLSLPIILAIIGANTGGG